MGMKQQRGSQTTTTNKLPAWMLGTEGRIINYPRLYVSKATQISKLLVRSGGVFTDPDMQTDLPLPPSTYAAQASNEILGIANLRTRSLSGNTILANTTTLVNNLLNGVDSYAGVETAITTSLNNAGAMFSSVTKTPYLVAAPVTVDDTFIGVTVGTRKNLTNAESATVRAMDNRLHEKRNAIEGMAYADKLAANEIKEIEMQYRAGIYQREYDQGSLEAAYKTYMFEDTWEEKRLEIVGNALRVSMSTFSAETRPYYKPNKWVGAIGGALSGAATGIMTGNPYLAVGGAVAGGALGYQTMDTGGEE